MFQFTHPVRGATASWMYPLYPIWFQFTHPVRGATPGKYPPKEEAKCFNSRTP